MMTPLDSYVRKGLDSSLERLELKFESDVISIYGLLQYGIENRVKAAIEAIPTRKSSLAIILDTSGGIAEVVERIVFTIRQRYTQVVFIVPDKAMSAGTLFVMSGNRILMNYSSVLGPIDPQLLKDGKYIPALSYLNQFESLVKKSREGKLTTPELTLINKLDLAELDTFRQARDLSTELVQKWLLEYKFRDWKMTGGGKVEVNDAMRKERAGEIGKKLSDNDFWHSHARGINFEVLRKELHLRIDRYDEDAEQNRMIHEYFDLFSDFLTTKGASSFVHSRYHF